MRHAWGSKIGMGALVVGLCLADHALWVTSAAAAPGSGAGKVDLTTNVQVLDSASSPVVVGEVVGVNPGVGLYVALAPSLANVDPPLLVVVHGYNSAGITLKGTDNLYYTDAACTTTPYFTVPVAVYTPTGVIVTSSGTATSYQIYKPGAALSTSEVLFSARRDLTINNGACDNLSQSYNAVQADATTYSITLTPPFKMKNP